MDAGWALGTRPRFAEKPLQKPLVKPLPNSGSAGWNVPQFIDLRAILPSYCYFNHAIADDVKI
ncbi:MAG TPA: hypothetical protein PK156_49050 [Polyangium sp.]|nr:hypothetical protein [Polyangium sp.]